MAWRVCCLSLSPPARRVTGNAPPPNFRRLPTTPRCLVASVRMLWKACGVSRQRVWRVTVQHGGMVFGACFVSGATLVGQAQSLTRLSKGTTHQGQPSNHQPAEQPTNPTSPLPPPSPRKCTVPPQGDLKFQNIPGAPAFQGRLQTPSKQSVSVPKNPASWSEGTRRY